jgi:hypothetical protein
MKHLRYLLLAALVAMPLTACDEDDDTGGTTPVDVVVYGTVSGTVSIEGAGVAGVSVSLVGTSSQTATTSSSGAYSFANVEAGSYGVTISGIPAGATFATTSATTSITTSGQTVTVDFSGSYIRTSTIAGQVMVGGMGIAGVSVTATGAEGAKSAVTDNAGNYSFSGLRAGNYTVALSNIPAAYTFATTTQTVTVGTGEAKVAGFFGTAVTVIDPVTATILIKSVTTAAGVAQNPAAIAGLMVVTLQIDPGQNDLNNVKLLLDGVEIASQTLANTAPGQDNVRMLQQGIFEVDFTINTADFNGTTGAVTHTNGTKGLSASLGINNASSASVETSIDLTFANADTFIGTVTPSKMPVISTTGVLYWGGSVTMDVVPVNYSGKTTASVTATFSNNAAAAGTTTYTDGTAPFSFTWPSTGAGNVLTGYQSAVLGTETFGVLRAQYSDNTLYTGGALNLATGVSIDNVAPPAVVYTLTNQVTPTGTDCCANNWVGPNYSFAAGLAAFADNAGGVGGVTATYHMGTASSTAAAAALPAITTGADAGVAPAILNTDYRTVAVITDALQNSTQIALTTTSATNPLNNTVGFDSMAPPAVTVGGVTAAQTTFNAASAAGVPMTFAFTADDRSGFSADPLQGWFHYQSAAGTFTRLVSGSATSSTAVSVPAANWPVCTANPVAAVRNTPGAAGAQCVPDVATGTGPDGYYTLQFVTQDRAGNQSAAFDRAFFLDATAPTTGNAVGPTLFTGGAATTFTATVTDNIEVGTTWFGLGYGAAPFAYIPFDFTTTQADGDWDATFTKTATATTTFNFVRQINTVVGALLATGNASSIRTLHTDAAGNPSAAASINTFAAGAVTGNAAVGAGAETYVLAAPAGTNLCDGSGAAACAAANKKTVNLTYTATGTTGTFVNPFAGGGKLYIYAVVDADAVIFDNASTYYLIATLDGDAATMTDDNVNRFYTWTYALTTADFAKIPVATVPVGGVMNLAVLASTKNGDALHSAYDLNVTRVAGK